MKLLWMFTTPRRLRRNALVLLLIWTAVAIVHYDGTFEDIDQHLPRTAIPTAPLLAPRTADFGMVPTP